jgi:DNA-binding transcriptional LysR family regulator
MDKLRAIEYFNRAAEAGSFAAAARSFDVSTPAVTQLVASLERSLGITLFHRSTRGLTLTADGERVYEASRKVAADMHDLEQRFGQRGAKPRGTLTVGLRQAIGQNCVMPRIGRFLARFPDVELVTRTVRKIEDLEAEKIDIAVLQGWPPDRDLVVRPLAQTRWVVCASPEYWMRAGMPRDPDELRDHECLVYRALEGMLLDRWTFAKGAERRTVDVKSRLFSDDRNWIEEAALAGAGVVRLADLTTGRFLSAGLLVPALTDWELTEAPTIYAAYPRHQRQSKLVRAFLEFVTDVFAELEREHRPTLLRQLPRVAKPEWFGRVRGRHSAYVARPRKRGA